MWGQGNVEPQSVFAFKEGGGYSICEGDGRLRGIDNPFSRHWEKYRF